MRAIALLLCITLFGSACATSGSMMTVSARPAARDATELAVLADYARSLPIGSRVRATLASGRTFHGTLLKATPTALVLQRRARIPEAPVEIPLADVRAVELDTSNGNGIGRAVVIGVVSGGVAVGTLFLIAALVAWD